MIAQIFVALAIMPLSALVFGALFFHNKNKLIHIPSFLAFGLLTMYVDMHYFYRAYEVTLANGQWGPAAGTMGLFSVLTSLNSFAFALLGAAVYSLFSKFTKKQDTYGAMSYTKILACFVLAASTAIYMITDHHKQSASQKIIAKASGQLTPELASELIQIGQGAKDKTMIQTLLMNPTCPEAVLKDFAQKEEVVYRATVLKNPNVPQEIVNQLATDKNEVVRYHVVINKKVTLELLEQLAQDPAKDVRKKAQSELENRKTN